jgi:hypothetical protein
MVLHYKKGRQDGMARNPKERGLLPLTEGEVGWLAGLYEGEGYCGLRGHTSFRVSITMTDLDVIDRIHKITGVGTVLGPIDRGHKPIKIWSVGGPDGIALLETILPWLGERRSVRAKEAIDRWKSYKKQTRPGDTHCIHGHELTDDNTFPVNGGKGRGCRTCRKAAVAKYNAKRRRL